MPLPLPATPLVLRRSFIIPRAPRTHHIILGFHLQVIHNIVVGVPPKPSSDEPEPEPPLSESESESVCGEASMQSARVRRFKVTVTVA